MAKVNFSANEAAAGDPFNFSRLEDDPDYLCWVCRPLTNQVLEIDHLNHCDNHINDGAFDAEEFINIRHCNCKHWECNPYQITHHEELGRRVQQLYNFGFRKEVIAKRLGVDVRAIDPVQEAE